MFKRNLVVIVIASLALIFTSSALGQEPNLMGTKGNRPKPRAVRVAVGDVNNDGFKRRRPRTTARGLTVNGTGGNDTLQKGLTKVGSGTLPMGVRNRNSIKSPRDSASGESTGRRPNRRGRN